MKDGENGLICKKNDICSLVKCMERLLDNKTLRMKMGEDGYRKFKASFTLQAFEKKFAEGLEWAMDKR